MDPEHGALPALSRLLVAIPPASGAVVMGTGIVSTDLLLAGHDTLSLTTLVLAAAIWVVLALLLSSRAAGRPPRRN